MIDDGIPIGHNGLTVSKDSGNSGVKVWNVLLKFSNFTSNNQPPPQGFHRSHSDLPLCKIMHLISARIFKKALNKLSNDLFGADDVVNRNRFWGEKPWKHEVLNRPHPRNFFRHLEQKIGHLTRQHVGFIITGGGNQ